MVVAAIALGATASAALFVLLRAEEYTAVRLEFERDSQERISALWKTLDLDFLELHDVKSLFDGDAEVTRKEFCSVSAMLLKDRPSVRAFQWVPRVRDSERLKLESDAGQAGYPRFQILERDGKTALRRASRRDEYYPIFFVEPSGGNVAAQGADLAADPAAWVAMCRARDSGEAAMSREIVAPDSSNNAASARLFLPVYQRNAAVNTVEERRKHLAGFVVGVLSFEGIAKESLATFAPSGIDIQFIDNTNPNDDKVLYEHLTRIHALKDAAREDRVAGRQSEFSFASSKEMGGRRLNILCTPNPQFIASKTTWLPWIAAAGGLLLTGLLAAYLAGIADRNVKAACLAAQLTRTNRQLEREIADRRHAEATLRTNQTMFETVYNSSSDAMMLVTPEGRLFNGNPAAIAMFVCKDECEFNACTPATLSPEYQPDGVLSSEKAKQMLDMAVQNGSHQFEWQYQRKDGSEFPAIVLLTRMELDGKTMLQANVRDIAKRKQTEAALQASERRFRLLAENVTDVIWTMDPSGRFTYISPSFEQMVGIRWEEGMKLTFADNMTPASAALCNEAMETLTAEIKDGKEPATKNLELELLHKNGSIVYTEVVSKAMCDEAGHLAAIVGVTRNINDRKRVETRQALTLARLEGIGRLREELFLPAPLEEKFKKITDAAVELLDLDFCRIWTIQPGDLCDAGCAHATAEEESHRCKWRDKCLHLMASSGRYTQIDGDHRRVPFNCYKIGRIASGQDVKFLTNDATNDPRIHDQQWAKNLGLESFAGYKLRDTHGEPIGVLAMFSKHPVSEEDDALLSNLAETTSRVILDHKAADVLSQENAKLSAMISGMEEGVAFADAGDTIIEINDFMCRLLEQPREAVLGQRIEDIPPGKILEDIQGEIGRFKEKIGSGPLVLQRSFGDAETILRVQPIYREGRYDGVLFNVIDVSELVRARREAEVASETKSRFLANMSHEIRTPMTAILGYADLLADPAIDIASRNNYLGVIRRNGEHLLALINDILDLSKIEAGKLAVDMRRCRVAPLLADVANAVRPRAEERGISVSIEYPGEIPETILTDGARLHQAVLNLVGNAVKFTEKGSVRIVASFLPHWGGDQPAVRIEVIDTGIGIRAEKLPRLFRPFEQGDSSVFVKFGGTGLGLAISRQIVHLLGGELTVTSEWGQGSTFALTVPTGNIKNIPMIVPAETEQESADLVAESAVASLAGMKVLLAEDGDDNRRLIKAILEMAGAEVQCAENGRQAVEMAEAGDFGAILMDINMPVMDGYEATRLLRSRGYTGPILALTANAMSGDNQRCREAGCDEYLPKPIDRAQLIETIARCAGKWSSPEAAPPAGETPQENPAVSQYADDPEIAPILGEFVGRLQGQVDAMRQACADGQHDELQRFAHRLKGAGGSYGYSALTKMCKPLEDAAKACDVAAEGRTLGAVAALVEAICNEYSQNVSAGRFSS